MAISKKIKATLLSSFLSIVPYFLGFGLIIYFRSKYLNVAKEFVNPEKTINEELGNVNNHVGYTLESLAKELYNSLHGFNFIPSKEPLSVLNALNQSNFLEFTKMFKSMYDVELYDFLQKETLFMLDRLNVKKAKELYNFIGIDFESNLF